MLRYAEQPLAERAFIAEQAQRVEVRRSGGPVTLAEAADIVLSTQGRSVQDLDFDSRRRADGRWIITAAPRDGGATATWVYDHSGRSLQPVDDAARRLMGVEPAPAPAPVAEPAQQRSAPEEPSRPRLTAVPSVVEDAIEDVAPPAGRARTADQPTVVIPVEPAPVEPAPVEPAPVEPIEDVPAEPVHVQPEPAQPAATADRTSRRRAPRPKGKRSSVPSWDEILFGAPSHDAD